MRRMAGRFLALCCICAAMQCLVVDAQEVTVSSSAASPYSLYPAGSIQSLESADRALVAVEHERADIEARFAGDERACHPKFFASSCLEDAKERRRIELAKLRTVEVEAKAFKRHARVAERDEALAERRAEEEAEAPLRLQEQKENEARSARKAASASTAGSGSSGGSDTLQNAVDVRSAQHEIKLQQRQKMEIANARKRSDNVSAYQKKVREAEAHQREIAAKHAEKEREKSAKDVAPAK